MVNLPPQAQMQQKMQLENAPDSVVTQLVKNFATNELVLRAADDAHFTPSPDELAKLRSSFLQARDAAWMQIRVAPALLADSAKTIKERERLASARVDYYLDQLASGKAPFAPVPPPLTQMLRAQAKVSVNAAGVEHAVDKATKLRAAEDSVRKATQPTSVVPMTGEENSAPAPATTKADTPAKK
jgi:hypothetical protein